jgi:hypothetical protein
MDVLEMTATYGMSRIDTAGHAATSDIGLLAGVLDKVMALRGEFDTATGQIRSSADFTPSGKAGQLGRVGMEYADRLLKFDKVIEQSQRHLSSLRDKVTISPVDPDNVVRVLREQELRMLLRNMDTVVVQTLWFDAIDKGDVMVFDAIRNAPSVSPLVGADALAKGELLWVDKRDPSHAKEIRDLDSALRVVIRAIADTRAHIVADAKLPESDPLAQIAGE